MSEDFSEFIWMRDKTEEEMGNIFSMEEHYRALYERFFIQTREFVFKNAHFDFKLEDREIKDLKQSGFNRFLLEKLNNF